MFKSNFIRTITAVVDYVMLKNINLCKTCLNETVIKCWKQTVLVIRDYYQIVYKIVFIYKLVSFSRNIYIFIFKYGISQLF